MSGLWNTDGAAPADLSRFQKKAAIVATAAGAERAGAAGPRDRIPPMLDTWLKRSRRRRILAHPFPHDWRAALDRDVRCVAVLDGDERQRLEAFVQILLAEAAWSGEGGFALEDEARVVIAGQAAMLLLGTSDYDYCFDNVRRIRVFADARAMDAGSRASWASNESLVVLAWDEVLHGCRSEDDGRNVVIAAFARRLAALAARSGGTWLDRLEREFDEAGGESGNAKLLDRDGLADGTDFFGAATELFFERAVAFRQQHESLYDVLSEFYSLCPVEWSTGVPTEDNAEEQPLEVLTTSSDLGLEETSSDASYMRAQFLNDEGKHEEAVLAYRDAIAADPDDCEASRDLGATLSWLGRHDEARAALDRAIELDPDDQETRYHRAALLVEIGEPAAAIEDLARCDHSLDVAFCRGRALIELRRYRPAIREFSAVIRMAPDNADAYRARSRAYAAVGDMRKAKADSDRAASLEADA